MNYISISGPLLYLLYVESLSKAGLKANHFMFADDTALLYYGSDQKKLEKLINKDLKLFSQWLCANKLILNENKTVYIRFQEKNKKVLPSNLKINYKCINQVTSHKYLGLTIDEKLNWDKHVDDIFKKLTGFVGAFRHINSFLSSKCKNMFYFAHIQSILSYLIPIWANTSQYNINRVQRLQNKAIKAIYNIPYETRTNTLYTSLPIFPLIKLKQLESCKLVYKIQSNSLKSNITLSKNSTKHNYNTRTAELISQNKVRTEKGLKSPIYTAVKQFNELPSDIKNAQNYNIFIKKLKNYIKEL